MFVWWKSADEWANDVHRFALRTGEVEVVETVNYFQTEAGSPVLAMAEEVILRISQTVRAALRFVCCAQLRPFRSCLCTHCFCSLWARIRRSLCRRIQVIFALRPLQSGAIRCCLRRYRILL